MCCLLDGVANPARDHCFLCYHLNSCFRTCPCLWHSYRGKSYFWSALLWARTLLFRQVRTPKNKFANNIKHIRWQRYFISLVRCQFRLWSLLNIANIIIESWLQVEQNCECSGISLVVILCNLIDATNQLSDFLGKLQLHLCSCWWHAGFNYDWMADLSTQMVYCTKGWRGQFWCSADQVLGCRSANRRNLMLCLACECFDLLSAVQYQTPNFDSSCTVVVNTLHIWIWIPHLIWPAFKESARSSAWQTLDAWVFVDWNSLVCLHARSGR